MVQKQGEALQQPIRVGKSDERLRASEDSIIGSADASSSSGDPLKPIIEPSLLSAFSDDVIAKLLQRVGT